MQRSLASTGDFRGTLPLHHRTTRGSSPADLSQATAEQLATWTASDLTEHRFWDGEEHYFSDTAQNLEYRYLDLMQADAAADQGISRSGAQDYPVGPGRACISLDAVPKAGDLSRAHTISVRGAAGCRYIPHMVSNTDQYRSADPGCHRIHRSGQMGEAASASIRTSVLCIWKSQWRT